MVAGDVLTEVEAAQRFRVIRNPRYQISVDVSDQASETYTTQTTVEFGAKSGASSFIDLVAQGVDEIVLNGKALPASAWNGSRIALDQLARHNTLTVRSVHRYSDDGQGLTRVRDAEDGNKPYLHTQFEHFSAHTVFPCFDQPDLKATYTWDVTAPAEWTVLNNSPEVARDTVSPAASRWHFGETPKISTYLTAFVGGHFHKFETDPYVTKDGRKVPIALYCRESQAAALAPDVQEWFDILKGAGGKPGAIRLLSDRLGVEFPYAQYLQVVVPGFQAGAMENVGLVTFAESVILRGGAPLSSKVWRANCIVHELVHQWFGNLVSPKWWRGIWLNESFATWGASIITPMVSRYRNGKIQDNNAKVSAAALDQKVSTHAVDQPIPSTAVVDEVFDRITYEKGSGVLTQLGAAVGEDVVWRGLREHYFPKHAGGNATLGDFLSAIGKAAGRNLTGWAKQWLLQPGINVLSPRFSLDAAGNVKNFSLEQTGAVAWTPQLRTQVLNVGLFDVKPDRSVVRRVSVPVTVRGRFTRVPALDGSNPADLVLVNDGDLSYTKVTLDAKSLETAKSSLGFITDPLARKQVWTALSDMVRDAKMPAQDFVDVAARFIPMETDLTTVETVLGQARGAIVSYEDASLRDADRAKLAAVALEQVKASAGDPQRQVSWMTTYVGTAVVRSNARNKSQSDIALLKGLLDGSVSLPGVSLAPRTDLRWSVVATLAAAGEITRSDIDREAATDTSLQGQAAALRCRASLPDAAAKAEAYRLITKSDPRPGDPQLTPQNLRALVQGFNSGSASLTASYVARYPEMVAEACRSRSEKDVAYIVPGLFPPSSAAGIKSAEAALQRPELTRSARRYIEEGLDDARRAVAARAVSTAAVRKGPELGEAAA